MGSSPHRFFCLLVLNCLRVEQHPDKPFIGRIAHGFDFLGYHLTPTNIAPARQTLQNFVQRIARLYEQGADAVRIGQYVRNWWRWLRSSLNVVFEARLREKIGDLEHLRVPISLTRLLGRI